MANTVINVEFLSKQYRLGEVGTGTLSHDLNRWWHKVRGKEDPYLKIGEENDRIRKGSSDYVWALRDINFEVKQGEVLGIIGKNGAGKSTLLKLLSRTTAPTTGAIKMKGRVASLLEVGTGFHPELSGRDNIYLNGAILGMTKAEIRSKFDEIVDFSGVERYIDTPVKRYSSGMYVRLAFAVAAHLDPEILIVDEVLAVGDAEFQKKALGKMKDVSSGEGRTILFVSHSMGAISAICNRGLLMKNGRVTYDGGIDKAVELYNQVSLGSETPILNAGTAIRLNLFSSCKLFCIKEIKILDESNNLGRIVHTNDTFKIKVKVFCSETLKSGALDLMIQNKNNENLLYLSNNPDSGTPLKFKQGINVVECSVFKFPLNSDNYKVLIGLTVPNVKWLIKPTYIGDIEVIPAKEAFDIETAKSSRAFCTVSNNWKILN